jgi:DNA transformation protein
MRSDLVDHCLELLSPLGAVRAQRMFGGHGLYCDDLFFALIAADRLYLKVDSQSQEAFAAAGCEPFVYQAAGRATTMGYWSVPVDAMESPAMMQPWARLALAAALRARAAKASAAPRKARAARAHAQAGRAARRK